MSLFVALEKFISNIAQCDSLIRNVHKQDARVVSIMPVIDQKQVTVAAFLNLFIAWEGFVEDAMINFMCGNPTISGINPTRYVTPENPDAARKMLIGIHKYFDFANYENLIKISDIYFDAGYPFKVPLLNIATILYDLKTMRNAAAHITSTTQNALEGLAQRKLLTPRLGIDLYTLLTSTISGGTVFTDARDNLLAAATQIANGYP